MERDDQTPHTFEAGILSSSARIDCRIQAPRPANLLLCAPFAPSSALVSDNALGTQIRFAHRSSIIFPLINSLQSILSAVVPAFRKSIVFSTSLLLEFCDVTIELVEVLSLLR